MGLGLTDNVALSIATGILLYPWDLLVTLSLINSQAFDISFSFSI
jgi:hypothetical protein